MSPELNKVLISAHPLLVSRTPPTTTQFMFSNSKDIRDCNINLFILSRTCLENSFTIREEKFFRRVDDLAFQRKEYERNSLRGVCRNVAAYERNKRALADIVDTDSGVLAKRLQVG